MARPKGSLNKTSSKLPPYKPDQILKLKVKILQVLLECKATTIRSAAILLHIPPVRAHHWAKDDKDFGEMIRMVREVRADLLEEELAVDPNVIAKIFLLKGLRPMYRDSYKVELTNENLENLLKELRDSTKPKDTEECPQKNKSE